MHNKSNTTSTRISFFKALVASVGTGPSSVIHKHIQPLEDFRVDPHAGQSKVAGHRWQIATCGDFRRRLLFPTKKHIFFKTTSKQFILGSSCSCLEICPSDAISLSRDMSFIQVKQNKISWDNLVPSNPS
jgi:hypothetical protein